MTDLGCDSEEHSPCEEEEEEEELDDDDTFLTATADFDGEEPLNSSSSVQETPDAEQLQRKKRSRAEDDIKTKNSRHVSPRGKSAAAISVMADSIQRMANGGDTTMQLAAMMQQQQQQHREMMAQQHKHMMMMMMALTGRIVDVPETTSTDENYDEMR